MKTDFTVPKDAVPCYAAPQTCVHEINCGLSLAGSNTGESFTQEEDYDGF